MGPVTRIISLSAIAIAAAAIPATAHAPGSHPGGGAGADAAAEQRPDLHRWRMTRHGFGASR